MSANLARRRATFNGIKQELYRKGIRFGLLYPARLRVTFDGESSTPLRKQRPFTNGALQANLGLPNVMGCVDGTQIPITAPAENEADYVNRKSFHSINVQICDAAYIVTNVEAKWPGSVHDSRIYRECRLSTRFARGKEAKALTRAQVEMTLGILKSRFQCLQKLRVTPERACDIIVAYVVLHNIAIIREQHPTVQINDPADDHPIPADVQDGRAARDLIARNYF
ncbi:putative nuclease HARBI1 [Merluccius polli]|uniref:Nuclease HARBI1 n=1 Tax=Merluccius polli TaxID=89951 RepID=A0AA47NBU2_MERPO|nr:putative nuclease HARBI1 [Merluccius polli]